MLINWSSCLSTVFTAEDSSGLKVSLSLSLFFKFRSNALRVSPLDFPIARSTSRDKMLVVPSQIGSTCGQTTVSLNFNYKYRFSVNSDLWVQVQGKRPHKPEKSRIPNTLQLYFSALYLLSICPLQVHVKWRFAKLPFPNSPIQFQLNLIFTQAAGFRFNPLSVSLLFM